jgi:transcriptional regulator with XRE-family HTH domain
VDRITPTPTTPIPAPASGGDADTAAVRRLLDTLAAHRRRKGLTRAEVARRMRTTRAHVARLEQQAAAGGGLQLATVQRYARAVGTPLGLLTLGPAGLMVFGADEHSVTQPGTEVGVGAA